mmetsp:Transcript_11889/g.16427  ORF Transcript_11889/g.16427 Transcript_11889/m.16427 type:complete len:164 (-) Transcript_11889:199-690(-)|eukprot:CAMPEP_0185732280 /NCGR_PEP_ID=MMETSP1171-20130828/15614_1 /TAXON_ID=374046 /ORGANISM="Helicotheca tamensis, Strain CCMP826" /LENGTH=163 /DNA_ID=CAMNT_0028401725 /DNA_START=121 /DNA_END=612 /DNA_ORIENTATION=+
MIKKFLLPFILGIILGIALQSTFSSTPNVPNETAEQDTGIAHGVVKKLAETPIKNTVHVDEKGRPITKKQLLDPFLIPNFAGFSVATFQPGQTMMPVHDHVSMHEIFYVVQGTGTFRIDDVDHILEPGMFLHIAPHEKHGIWVPEEAEEDLLMVVCGITVGEK